MKKKGKKKKKEMSAKTLLSRYRDPLKPGSLGGVTRFAKANNITIQRAREVLQCDLRYTLPVMVYGIDEQWTADLIEVNNIAEYNRGYRYLDGGGCVFQTHVGGTREEQDGKDGDGCHDEDTEEE